MKKMILGLISALMLTSCVAYAEPVAVNSCVTYCDDYGCREVCAPHYYYQGVTYYWDAHFGCWIGPRGYWRGGIFHAGFHPGYGQFYHGGGYHGGFHGGGSFHGGGHSGGHGGHR